MSDNYRKQDKVLTEKIDELESLISSRTNNENNSPGTGTVPILDELVTEEDLPDQEHQLDLLAGRLEQKISSELDEIVTILKINLRKNILDELQDQLKTVTDGKSED